MPPRRIAYILLVLIFLFGFEAVDPPILLAQSSTTLSVNGAQSFQRMDGFGVNVNSASWNNGELRPALDLLVDQLGASIFRVVIDNADWEASNDNGDPNAFNWTYYNTVYTSPKFEELWSTISYLNQKGITSGLMLNVMGPTAGWMGGSHINTTAEDEWVEMMASLIYYGRVTRGLQISLFSPMNEPDWDGIEGPQVDQWQYARLLRKLSQKLDANGLSAVRLVGPDTAQIGTGVTGYMPELMRDSVVMSKIDHFGFHNYAGDSGGADGAIKNSAYRAKNFWITEVTNIWDILAHLSQGPSGIMVWDAYDSVYNHAILAGRGSTPPNDVGNGPPLVAYNTSTRAYTPRKGFYECAQLFRWIAPGAVRIAATGSSTARPIFAFHNPVSGRLTIVGRNPSAGSFTLTGTLSNLPPMTRLEFYQTNASSNLQRGSDVIVSNNSTFSVQVSGGSVFTLTGLTAGSTQDVEPPVVEVVAPDPNSTVSGSVRVAASASDNVGVAGVEFLLDGLPMGAEDTAAPFEIQWNASTATRGSHQVIARARDIAGNATLSAAVAVTVSTADTAAPVVTVTAPSAGAALSGSITVSASASDDVGVTGVSFLVDGLPIGLEDAAAPYSILWNTIGTANGPHTVSARARDAAGKVTTSSTVAVTVSNDGIAPTVTITAPTNGAAVSGRVVMRASASDNVAVAGVQFFVDGVAIEAEDTSAPYTRWWTTASAPAGPHSIVARARDASGNVATSAAVVVGVNGGDATGPLVSITAPTGGATVSGTVTITAAASDNVGVAGIQILVDGTALGTEDTTAPYSWSWNTTGLPNGSHAIAARARDSAGNVTISSNTMVTVSNGDTIPPIVTVTSPAGGSTVASVVTISASASDNVGVAGLQFLQDGVPLGSEDTQSPYTVIWDTSTTANGAHVITARVRDLAGNQAVSAGVTLTVANVVAVPSAGGLVAAFGFDEGSGSSTTDASGRGQVGTLRNATWSPAGRFGTAISFNGTTSLVTIPDSAVLDLTNAMTLEAWVRPTALGAWRTVLLKEASAGLSYALYASDAASRESGYVNVGTDIASTSPSALPLNVWTHLALTFDGTRLRLYVNGNLVTTTNVTGSLRSTSLPLQIGGNTVWGEYFAGLIDEVRVYNRALTAAEISRDMETPVGPGS